MKKNPFIDLAISVQMERLAKVVAELELITENLKTLRSIK